MIFKFFHIFMIKLFIKHFTFLNAFSVPCHWRMFYATLKANPIIENLVLPTHFICLPILIPVNLSNKFNF